MGEASKSPNKNYNMNNNTQMVQSPKQSLREIMSSPAMGAKLNGILGNEKVANSFISSVISVANGNTYLRNADPMTIVGSAMVAATLQLPIVPTLGMAYIIPYGRQAQFQIGYKGLIQLAERSGQVRNIIDEVVYEGQLLKKNKFTGEFIFDEDAKTSDTVIGYMARLELTNGFAKTIYWTKDEVEAHAKRFSQAYQKGWQSPWKSDFDQMARKTLLKALINKYAPMDIAMQQAMKFDQAVVKPTTDASDADFTIDCFDVEYADNPEEVEERRTAMEEAALEAAKKQTKASNKTDSESGK